VANTNQLLATQVVTIATELNALNGNCQTAIGNCHIASTSRPDWQLPIAE